MYATIGQLLTDVIVRQLGHWDIELIAHITPQGTQHLVVELVRLVVGHQAGSQLQTLGGHLVGLLTTHLGNIGVVDGTLTEDDKQRDEHHYQRSDDNPISS